MTWVEITVVCPPDSVEAVTAILLDLGCKGIAETGGDPSRLAGFLPPELDFDSVSAQLERSLSRLPDYGLPAPISRSTRTVQDADWANEWRKYFQPLEIGQRLVIKPTWEEYAGGPGRVVVEIDPGQAFGTGGHATTRLCLEALDRHVRSGMVVADIGTGSGILAIAAAKLGATTVHATDSDLLPRQIARENVARNGLQAVVTIHEMEPFERLARGCDLVVANIIAATIVEITPSVLERLKPGGLFIASGIVDDMLPPVLAGLSASGFELIETREEDVWRATIARKPK